MPWSQTSPMDERTRFIADYLRETFSISELCAQYSVSRKTGYKWIDRYLTLGPAGLEEYSRRPRLCPRQTPEHVVESLLSRFSELPNANGHAVVSRCWLIAVGPKHPIPPRQIEAEVAVGLRHHN